MGEFTFQRKLDVATLLWMGRRDRVAILRELEHSGKRPEGSADLMAGDLPVIKEIMEDYQRAVDRQNALKHKMEQAIGS